MNNTQHTAKRRYTIDFWCDGFGDTITCVAASPQAALDRVRRHLADNDIEIEDIEIVSSTEIESQS